MQQDLALYLRKVSAILENMKNRILILFLLVLPFCSFAAPQIQSVSGENLLSGEPVAMKLQDVGTQGKKGLVVVFLSARCPCSNSHVAEVRDLAQNYKDFAFVAVHSNMDEGEALTKPYFEKAHLPFPVIADAKAHLADQFQALKTPHAYIVAPDGHIAYQGGVSNSNDCAKSDRKYLREALEDLHGGKPVRTPEGRTLGCVISRGEKNVW